MCFLRFFVNISRTKRDTGVAFYGSVVEEVETNKSRHTYDRSNHLGLGATAPFSVEPYVFLTVFCEYLENEKR